MEKDVDFLFIHVGSIQHVKNQETLVKAFSHMLCDGVRARLLLIGRRFDEKIYQMLEPYFSSEIIYLGEQENPRSFMSFCDAFCMSSLWEGMPISIIEAFSVGCPPIVTPVGGCLNMIKDGENGLLAEDASEEAYYRALKRFITLAKNERIEMSRNALKSYQECYSIEKTAEEYLLLFRGDK